MDVYDTRDYSGVEGVIVESPFQGDTDKTQNGWVLLLSTPKNMSLPNQPLEITYHLENRQDGQPSTVVRATLPLENSDTGVGPAREIRVSIDGQQLTIAGDENSEGLSITESDGKKVKDVDGKSYLRPILTLIAASVNPDDLNQEFFLSTVTPDLMTKLNFALAK